MAIVINDILQLVSSVLVEKYVNTTIAAPITAGTQVVTPSSMRGIYNGAQMLIDQGGANQETVTVLSTGLSTFQAAFAKSHAGGVSLRGATFPSIGANGQPLFTQTEMVGYVEDAHNEFLTRTESVYAVTTAAVTNQNRFYNTPADAARLDYVSIAGRALKAVSQDDLDLDDPDWPTRTDVITPTSWFQDQVLPGVYGLGPTPQADTTAELWYIQRGSVTMAIDSTLLVPDVLALHLMFGVLQRAFSKDGEMRDPMRAEYCGRRFRFIEHLVAKFMQGVEVGIDSNVPAAVAFDPMAVSADNQPQPNPQGV